MSRVLISFLAIALIAGPLAGCFGGSDDAAPVKSASQEEAEEILGQSGREKLVEAAAILPKNFSFPAQSLLPKLERTFVGTVGSGFVGYEAENDNGGMDYGTIISMFDVNDIVPVGQPVELVIDLFYDGSEGNNADLDIALDLPGTKTTYSSVSETFNWNFVLKTVVVNTVGVAGQPAQVGVQIASGVVANGFDYELTVRATYVKDVLTPYHAWALEVPPGTGGLIFESEKAGGDEHVTAQFIVVDPDDNLVKFVDFNDINIPTQSVMVPVSKSGTYIFYAYSMHGGFFRVKADVPLDNTVARPLALKEERVIDSNAVSPGLAGKTIINGTTPDDVNPTVIDFATSGAFPLRVFGHIEGNVVTQAKITLASGKGTVHKLVSVGKYSDERGTLGYTSDHEGGVNNVFDWQNIDKGSWTATIVNGGPAVEIGHTIVTYVR